MNVFKIAWRNVWRNTRRSLVTIGAMTLALFVMINYSGIVSGYLDAAERNILERELGDIQIHAPSYLDDRSLYKLIPDPDGIVEALESRGLKASARLLASGLVAAGDASAGALLKGIDVERDQHISQIHEHLSEGQWIDPGDPSGVVLGRRLAKILGVSLDDELVVLTQGADGSMANELYKVRGVLKGISDAVDRSGIFMAESAWRELIVLDKGAHQIIVRKPKAMLLSTAQDLTLRSAGKMDVKSWRQLVPTLASMFDSTQVAVQIMFTIVYIAIGIVILNAMLMAVFERIREFGVLKALGMGPARVFALIFVETVYKSVLAIVIGALLSLPMLHYLIETGLDLSALGELSMLGLAWDPIWRASVNTNTFVGPIVTLLVIVLLATLYPAFKAAFIRPVAAIRHQ